MARRFGQGGDPKWCWCASFRLRSADFTKANPNSNRNVLEQAVATTALEDRAPGLIAYRNSEPIGWVSLGPRDDYERLKHSRLLAPLDDEQVWSIACFVVSRRARREGVASALLEVAVGYARLHGAHRLEAYPVGTEGNRIPTADVTWAPLECSNEQASRWSNGAAPPRQVSSDRLCAGPPGSEQRPLGVGWLLDT